LKSDELARVPWVRIPPPPLNFKNFNMKNLLKGLVCYVLTIIVLIVGLALFNVFIIGDITIFKFFMGMLGFFILIRPAYNEWFDRFKKLFKFED